MNLRMQRFFREWDELDNDGEVDAAFVDQHEIEVLIQLNAELRERLDDQALRARFARNVDLLRDLMAEISDRIRRRCPRAGSRQRRAGDAANALRPGFRGVEPLTGTL